MFYVPRVLLLALRWPRRDKAGPHLEVMILSAALYELQGSCGVTMFLYCFTDKYVELLNRSVLTKHFLIYFIMQVLKQFLVKIQNLFKRTI